MSKEDLKTPITLPTPAENDINNEKLLSSDEEDDDTIDIDYLDDRVLDQEQDLDCMTRYFSPLQSGSLRGSIISVAAICFGPASLSFPVAFTNVGLIPGILMFVLLASIAYWSLNNLIIIARKKKILNYSKLIKECLGDKMLLLSDINNLVFLFGVLMAYEFTISNFFMDIVKPFYPIGTDDINTVKFYQMAICMFCLQLPLSLLKDISKLQYAGLVGTFGLFYTIIVIAVECPYYYQEGISENRSVELFKKIEWNCLDSFSILLYGFSSHNAVLTVYTELKKPTMRRSKKVLNRALLLQVILFSIIALFGFFSLVEKTPSIFILRPTLKILNGKDYYMIIAKVLFFIGLHCSYAITYNIIRGFIKSFFFKGENISFLKDFLICLGLLLVTNVITFKIDDVVKIVGILGGLCAVIVCYICPVLCYVKANDYHKYHWRNITSVGILIVICVLGFMSTGKTVYDNL